MSHNDAPRAGRREWIGLVVIALPCVLYAMDLTVLNLAVPQLSAQLKPSSAELLWIVDIYGFLVAGSLVTMGTLGDRIGRRRLLMIGAVAFGAASILAAFATTPATLIAARALLGVAGATLAPSTLSLIRNMFHDPKERTFAISVWVTSYSVGGAIGPVLGGVLLEFFWWGSVFLLAVPVMVLLLVLAPVLLPEYKDPDAGRLDLPSALLSLLAVLAVIYGLKSTAEAGFSLGAGLSVLVGLVLGLLFVRRQKGLADPFLDVTLFRSPAFTAAVGINILSAFVAFGCFFFTAQYLQLVLGLSPLEAGLWTLPSSLGFVIGSMSTSTIVRVARPAHVVAAGMGLSAVSFLVLSQISQETGLATIMVATILFALGLAPVFTLTTDLVVSAAPPERAGSAAALSETGAEFGGALGIAILGSAVTALYRISMNGAIDPGIPPPLAEAARSTLGGATASAAALPEASGQALLETARDAFGGAFGIASLACAAIAVGAALVAVLVLPRIGGAAQTAHQG
jgi:DHA2 family multidrug resistance protein-like MFS transporter